MRPSSRSALTGPLATIPVTLSGTLVLVLLAMALAGWPVVAVHAALPAVVDGQTLPTVAPMLDRVVPAVVNVSTVYTRAVRNPFMDDPFFRYFFRNPGLEQRFRGRSIGSGVIVDAARGYIVTNNHVVDKADEVKVTLADGRTLPARIVGVDTEVDLAVLAVKPEALTGISFAESARVRVGDFVVAIGNPFGLGQTVTSGIVSALGRSGLSLEGFEDFVQTDASINPGNSGGALVNLRGELVGINTAIIATSGGNVGIGFAIPANMVRAIMNQLVRYGEVRRGHIGVAVQELNADLAKSFGVDLRRGGALVVEVENGSAGQRAGMLQGDVIVQIGDREVKRPSDYHARAAVLMVGDAVPVTLLRGGAARVVSLRIGADNLDKLPGGRVSRFLEGVALQNLGQRRAGQAGVQIVDAKSASIAYTVGLRPGDVIVGANDGAVRSIGELKIAAARVKEQLVLKVARNGQLYNVPLR